MISALERILLASHEERMAAHGRELPDGRAGQARLSEMTPEARRAHETAQKRASKRRLAVAR